MTRNHPEDDIQRAIVRYLELQKPECIWFAVPNGGRRGKIEAARLKGLGVRAGVADLVFCWSYAVLSPHGPGPGWKEQRVAFVEVKAEKGRLSDAQVKFRARCERLGFEYRVVRSVEDVQALLRLWGLVRR